MTDDYRRKTLPIHRLKLDELNPRLPEELLGADQSNIVEWLERTSNLEELASSMLESGYFEHEPLIVRRPEDADGEYVVVEGNRRFATILILNQEPAAVDAGISFEFDSPGQPDQLDRLKEIPCVVVADESEVRKFLGFRHIGGIRTWSAEAKARYIVAEVDSAVAAGSGQPFKEVGKRVGTNALGVRGPYIALKTLHAARETQELEALARNVLRDRFGVWNRLLNSAEVREFIGLSGNLDYVSVAAKLESLNYANLGVVLRDLVPDEGSRIAVLQDSREVTTYGRVIANDAAREALASYRDLSIAAQIADGSSLPSRLKRIRSSVDLLVRNIDTFEVGPNEVEAAMSLVNAVRSLNALVRDRLDSDD